MCWVRSTHDSVVSNACRRLTVTAHIRYVKASRQRWCTLAPPSKATVHTAVLAPHQTCAAQKCLLLCCRPFALPSPLTVFGQEKTQFWVTTNAIVTFDRAETSYTPSGKHLTRMGLAGQVEVDLGVCTLHPA